MDNAYFLPAVAPAAGRRQRPSGPAEDHPRRMKRRFLDRAVDRPDLKMQEGERRLKGMGTAADVWRGWRSCFARILLIMCLVVISDADTAGEEKAVTRVFVGGLEFQGVLCHHLLNDTVSQFVAKRLSAQSALRSLRLLGLPVSSADGRGARHQKEPVEQQGLGGFMDSTNQEANEGEKQGLRGFTDPGAEAKQHELLGSGEVVECEEVQRISTACRDSTHRLCSRLYFTLGPVSKEAAMLASSALAMVVGDPTFAASLTSLVGSPAVAVMTATSLTADDVGSDGEGGIANLIHARNFSTHMLPSSMPIAQGHTFELAHMEWEGSGIRACEQRFADATARCNDVDVPSTSVMYISGGAWRERYYIRGALPGSMCGLYAGKLTSTEASAVQLIEHDDSAGCQAAFLSVSLEHGDARTFSSMFKQPLVTIVSELTETAHEHIAVEEGSVTEAAATIAGGSSQDPTLWRKAGLLVSVVLPSVSETHRDWLRETVGGHAIAKLVTHNWYGQATEHGCVTMQGRHRCFPVQSETLRETLAVENASEESLANVRP